MPGPAPNPQARRRNDANGWRTLEAECATPAPRWPLTGRKPAGLVELWRYLWRLPVAAIWHEQGAERLVARYALMTLVMERALTAPDEAAPDASKVAAELRQIEDRLLISPSTRLRARVLVADPVDKPKRATKSGKVANLDEYRDLDVG